MHKVSLFMHIMIKSALIHAPRERSDDGTYIPKDGLIISIHAPRERSDTKFYKLKCSAYSISIHAPRERSDNIASCQSGCSADFNPRSS